MQLFDVPQWLQNRHVLKNDIKELHQLLSKTKTPTIGDLSLDLLKKFYQEQSKTTFYKVIRLLGFYGVIYSGKLASYSGPNDTQPEVLNIHSLHQQDRLTDYFGNPVLFLLGSCGIKTFDQIRGVPVQSLKKLLECLPSFEEFLEKIPATIVTTTTGFFPLENSTEAKSIEKREQSRKDPDILSQPVDILNLSIRASNCLRTKGVKTIGALVRIKS